MRVLDLDDDVLLEEVQRRINNANVAEREFKALKERAKIWMEEAKEVQDMKRQADKLKQEIEALKVKDEARMTELKEVRERTEAANDEITGLQIQLKYWTTQLGSEANLAKSKDEKIARLEKHNEDLKKDLANRTKVDEVLSEEDIGSKTGAQATTYQSNSMKKETETSKDGAASLKLQTPAQIADAEEATDVGGDLTPPTSVETSLTRKRSATASSGTFPMREEGPNAKRRATNLTEGSGTLNCPVSQLEESSADVGSDVNSLQPPSRRGRGFAATHDQDMAGVQNSGRLSREHASGADDSYTGSSYLLREPSHTVPAAHNDDVHRTQAPRAPWSAQHSVKKPICSHCHGKNWDCTGGAKCHQCQANGKICTYRACKNRTLLRCYFSKCGSMHQEQEDGYADARK